MCSPATEPRQYQAAKTKAGCQNESARSISFWRFLGCPCSSSAHPSVPPALRCGFGLPLCLHPAAVPAMELRVAASLTSFSVFKRPSLGLPRVSSPPVAPPNAVSGCPVHCIFRLSRRGRSAGRPASSPLRLLQLAGLRVAPNAAFLALPAIPPRISPGLCILQPRLWIVSTGCPAFSLLVRYLRCGLRITPHCASSGSPLLRLRVAPHPA